MIGVQCERLRVASTGQGRRNLLRLRARAPQMRLKPQQGVSERGRGAPLGISDRGDTREAGERHAMGRLHGHIPASGAPAPRSTGPVTTQAPHLAQPKNIRLFRGTGRFGPMPASAPPYVGRLHGVLAVLPSTRIATVAHVELDQSFPKYSRNWS